MSIDPQSHVTDPADAFFVTYLNNRDFSVSMEEVVAAEPGVDAVQGAGSGILAVTAEALPGFVLADDAVSEWTWTFSTEVAPTGRPTDDDTEPTQPPAAGDGGGHDGGSLATTGAPRGIAAAAPALLGAGRVVVLRHRPPDPLGARRGAAQVCAGHRGGPATHRITALG